jgi:aminoglycoside 3'-phosphotransferase-1
MPAPIAVPDSMRAAVEGYAWTPATDGESGGAVFRLEAPDRPALYLKCGTGPVADDITAELARLVWLAPRLPVPAMRSFVRLPDEAFLLTAAVPGTSAYDYLVAHPARRAPVVGELARFLRRVHALSLADCPFHGGHALRLADARRNVDAGRVAEDDFDDARAGWTAEQVWNATLALLPLPFERVVTHGDFSLGNVLVDAAGRVAGCIDVGRAGAADPYQDLAILWNNLEEFGGGAQRELWRAYGVAEPDECRLQFHLCLDELF